MKRYIKKACLLSLIIQTAVAQVMWQKVPEINDEVAYAVINNSVMYVHPNIPDKPLPRGLFFLRFAGQQSITTPSKAQRQPVFIVENGRVNKTPYVYSFTIEQQSPSSRGYIYWDPRRVAANNIVYSEEKSPGRKRFVDPTRVMAKWREAENQRLAATQPQQPVMLDRDTLFENIVGISEDEFKRKTRAGGGAKPDVRAAQRVVDEQRRVHARAQAIAGGDWSQPTLRQLRKSPRVQDVEKRIRANQMGTGSLNLLVHDPNNPRETDIRYLHERFPDAFFLIASNFNALEGGMGNYNNNLSGMNYHPVQGEEACMATMPATIYRRYLLPPINLLGRLDTVFDIQYSNNNTPIIKNRKPNMAWTRDTQGDFTIGVHQNVIVSSGYNDDDAMIPRIDQSNIFKPAYNKEMPVSGPNVTRVTHLFTAAHNLMKKTGDREHESIARDILMAAYEAAILAAIDRDAKTLVLTMLGAGAFLNDTNWIVQALQHMRFYIAASDINIYIVVRHRDKNVQDQFEGSMRRLANEVKQPGTQGKPQPQPQPAAGPSAPPTSSPLAPLKDDLFDALLQAQSTGNKDMIDSALYSIFGLRLGMTQKELSLVDTKDITKRFKEISRKLHPDKYKTDSAYSKDVHENAFKEVSSFHDTLVNK